MKMGKIISSVQSCVFGSKRQISSDLGRVSSRTQTVNGLCARLPNGAAARRAAERHVLHFQSTTKQIHHRRKHSGFFKFIKVHLSYGYETSISSTRRFVVW